MISVNDQQLELYLSLFRGRVDVYARRWEKDSQFAFKYGYETGPSRDPALKNIFVQETETSPNQYMYTKGGCHCGAIKFKTAKDPFWVGACYCIDCRKISGSPYTVFAGYDKKDIDISGTPKNYASSEKVIRSFCEICGSPFAYIDTTSPDKIFIPVGVFDDPSSFKIEKHIWVSQKLPWVSIHDDLPQED